MKNNKSSMMVLVFVCVMIQIAPPYVYSQGPQQPAQLFKPEELNQLLAPIALYPDSLIAQILMASTYPLEIVQATRWANQNKNLKGDALTKALEKENWDPSVKSLVNFPQVLQMMNDKLDWTQKLGDAVLAQQKDVMDTIQGLRARAQAQGTLKSTNEQKVVVQEKAIVIEAANPQVVYVPTYNPTVVYGAWPYPSYPPAYYYPPGYVATAAFSFAAGVALTAAWGYAWGNCNWGGHSVNYNVNQNININNNINREAYKNKVAQRGGGQGTWQHNPENRKGVAYRDQSTAQKYNRAGSAQGVQDRQAYRGKGGQTPGAVSTQPAGGGTRLGTTDRGRQETMDRGGRQSASTMESRGQQTAFGGMDKGSNVKTQSDRGSASRQSMSSPQSGDRGGSGSRGGGSGISGGSRGGASGGGSRGGGRRR